MKQLVFILILCCTNFSFAQEIEEEFLPITLEEKEAFMSTKTGEYVFLAHAETNPDELRTTASGVVYNDISIHKVSKKETLSSITKKYKLDLAQLKKDNKLKSNALSLGQEIKIINRVLVTSSSPVITYTGEERIIARLRPGQSPSTLAPPPPDAVPVTVSAPQKSQSPDSKKPVSRKSTYFKPMVMPNTTASSDKNLEVQEVQEDDIKQESKDVIAAQRQLEEAQQKLALAKQEAIKKTAAKEEAQQKEVIVEKVAEKVVEAKPIEEKLEKIKPKLVIEETGTEVSLIEEKEKTEVKIPVKEVIEQTETPKTDIKIEVEGVDYHTIVKGDNLYKLAKIYNTTIQKLTELNNVKFNNLHIGQKLMLK